MIRIYESGNPSNYLEIEDLKKTNLPAVVTFYRSQSNADNKPSQKYGTKDSQYNGEFGFDRFDKKVMAEGLANKYEKLKDVEVKNKVAGDSYDYLCPYLSLYPPNVNGGINEVTLYVKLEEDRHKGTDEPDFGGIHFLSSDSQSIEIVGAQTNRLAKKEVQSKKIALTIGDNAKPIKIKCNQAFSTPITITAKTSKDTTIGQLIVVPNIERFTTSIQPIELHLGNVASKTVDKIPHSSLMKDVVKGFNTTSFNQAYINAQLSADTHKITLGKGQFEKYFDNRDGKIHLRNKTLAEKYNDLVESRYAALLVNQAQKNKAEEKIKETGQNLLEQFDKKYKYNKPGIKNAEDAYHEKNILRYKRHIKNIKRQELILIN